jgi:succinoglycan biosynthesis protein ExoA
MTATAATTTNRPETREVPRLTHRRPTVSVIIPMYNESGFIVPCIEGFQAQTYPADLMEIIVVDGGSTDGCIEQVHRLAVRDPRIRLVPNPRRLAAAAANIGIETATGEVLCFLSAHGVPERCYVEDSVDALVDTGAVGVGGRYLHVGLDARSRAIGLAMASPFGMASPHRSAEHRGEVDTISHPTFLRQALVDVGGYDETLARNEDYETNYRLRKAGGRLVFTPEISSVYRPRADLRQLAKQFHAYGDGKAMVLRRHPDSLRLRHLVPPIVVVGAVLSPFALLHPVGRVGVAGATVAYAALLAVAMRRARPAAHDADRATFVAALPVMHVAWGTGVLRGFGRALRRPSRS